MDLSSGGEYDTYNERRNIYRALIGKAKGKGLL
jgi:hypothetical protein